MTLAEFLAGLRVAASSVTVGTTSVRVAPTEGELGHLGLYLFPAEEDEFAENNDDDLRTDLVECTFLYDLAQGGRHTALEDACNAEQAVRTALTQAPGLVEVRPRIPGRIRRKQDTNWFQSKFAVVSTYREVDA